MKRPVRTIGLLVAAALLAGGCGQALQTSRPPTRIAPARPVVFDCGGKAHAKPSSLVLTCADAGDELVHLRWGGWGGIVAEATGYELVMTCVPSCVAGGTKTFRAVVMARGLELAGARTSYRQLQVAIETRVARPLPGLRAITQYSLTATGPALNNSLTATGPALNTGAAVHVTHGTRTTSTSTSTSTTVHSIKGEIVGVATTAIHVTHRSKAR